MKKIIVIALMLMGTMMLTSCGKEKTPFMECVEEYTTGYSMRGEDYRKVVKACNEAFGEKVIPNKNLLGK